MGRAVFWPTVDGVSRTVTRSVRKLPCYKLGFDMLESASSGGISPSSSAGQYNSKLEVDGAQKRGLWAVGRQTEEAVFLDKLNSLIPLRGLGFRTRDVAHQVCSREATL